MKYTHVSLGLLCSALLACEGQNSSQFTQPYSVGVGVGTMGLVVEPAVQTGRRTAVRLPVAFGSANSSTEVDGIDYDISGSVGGVGVLADYYPSGGSFRVTGGLFKTNLEATGRAVGSVEVGANTYAGVDLSMRSTPDNTVAPVVALGFNGHFGAGWSVSSDVGVMYIGGMSASVSDATGTVSASDLAAEMAAVNEELSDISVIPFIKLGATYRW